MYICDYVCKSKAKANQSKSKVIKLEGTYFKWRERGPYASCMHAQKIA